jgi:hypothetical protein
VTIFLHTAIVRLSAAAWVMSSLAYANPASVTVPHVRATDPRMAQAFHATYVASPTFRSLVDVIETSDVVVYLEFDQCRRGRLKSCLYLGPCKSQVRYLRIKIDPATPPEAIPALLGHELQHAAEVVLTPDVLDEESFVRLFRAIGSPCSPASVKDCWETERAQLVERAVSREMNGLPIGAPVADADINANRHPQNP